MKGLSPWALTAINELSIIDPFWSSKVEGFALELKVTADSVWATLTSGANAPVHFRVCFIPSGNILELRKRPIKNGIALRIECLLGRFDVKITLTYNTFTTLRYNCALTPSSPLFAPIFPRDILLQNALNDATKDFGEVHCVQRQTRSGLIYLSKPVSKLRMLYFQDLTSLSGYCEATGTSLSGVVGGSLPELGLSLPQSADKPLPAGEQMTISDAYVCLSNAFTEHSDQAVDYMNMLAEIYQALPKPATQYRDWPQILQHGLTDLIENPGCWSRVGGNSYLNAYLSDHDTPPEIMVQLAVLLPLLDYCEWSGEKMEVTGIIKKGLSSFYSPKLKSLLRWHPDREDKLKGDEEQKKPMVMDSWYLHHPLLNLSRLALKDDKDAKKLFLDSIGFAIKAAHKFKYQWPVFYKMDTLEILKAETEPGKGGEQDVAGLYTHVMLQAYELTGEQKYLNEAIKAANKFAKVGYELMYQANNTAFAAGALLRLYKITSKERYLNLSYRCLASIFQNVQLWDCNYGYGKNLPTFFALFPLSDAPYTAAYEEQEVFCAFHDYLKHTDGIEILPSVKLLCGEYIRYLIDRAPFYYPPMLPKEMLSDEIKTGEVEKDLWIALEDIHDGIEKSGEVGQEVYGAGNAFGILPRHFIKVVGEAFMIFIDGPFGKVKQNNNVINFEMLGHPDMSYLIKIVFANKSTDLIRYSFRLEGKNGEKIALNVTKTAIIGQLSGNDKIQVVWK